MCLFINKIDRLYIYYWKWSTRDLKRLFQRQFLWSNKGISISESMIDLSWQWKYRVGMCKTEIVQWQTNIYSILWHDLIPCKKGRFDNFWSFVIIVCIFSKVYFLNLNVTHSVQDDFMRITSWWWRNNIFKLWENGIYLSILIKRIRVGLNEYEG